MMKPNKNKAFSLVELSVTLLIVGIVTAAITSGVSLFQASKINKTISEITGYVTAVNNFKVKYKAWPGDMPNATSYWGTYNSSTNPNGVVNGDGNENISGSFTTEPLYAWQELALAGLIAGKYTGLDAGTPDFVAGTNIPASPSAYKGSYYYLYYPSASIYGTYGNALHLTANQDNTTPAGGAITPEDAHIIDVKIDDGFASTGNLYSLRSGNYNSSRYCVDNPFTSGSANYILSDNTQNSCRIFYWLNKI